MASADSTLAKCKSFIAWACLSGRIEPTNAHPLKSGGTAGSQWSYIVSALPMSTVRPCSWCAVHRYVGASSTASSVESIGLPRKARDTFSTPSRPTGATTLTGTSRLAASAKYTAEPPSSPLIFPKGPSRVSSATEPTTRSSGASGTPSGAARRGHHMPREAQLLQKVDGARIVRHLHPAAPELLRRVRIGAGRSDLAEVLRQRRSRTIGGGVAPGVVRLDDVDAVLKLHYALRPEVRTIGIERMRDVDQAAHRVDEVHDLLGPHVRRQAGRDEEPDHLTLARLRLLTDYRKRWRDTRKLERALDAVVGRQPQPADPPFPPPIHQ